MPRAGFGGAAAGGAGATESGAAATGYASTAGGGADAKASVTSALRAYSRHPMAMTHPDPIIGRRSNIRRVSCLP